MFRFLHLVHAHTCHLCVMNRACQDLPGCETALAYIDWRAALAKASELVSDEESVQWFPEYDCALLAIGTPSFPGGPIVRRHLSIIGLDDWVVETHWLQPPRYAEVQL